MSGYDARRRDERTRNVRPYVPVWDFNQEHSAAYFRKELKRDDKSKTQLSSRSRSNPFSGSDGSASETSASERAEITRQAHRMRSTMLSQTLTPESNTYVAKSGNKSN